MKCQRLKKHRLWAPSAAALSLFLAALSAPALFAPALFAQMNPQRELTVEEVRAELERRIGREATYQTIWNTGYDFYRLHLRNQDTALTIFRAYTAVRGLNGEQARAIRQAAIYWQKVHDYGITNVPVGIDNSARETVPSPRRGRTGTLKMARPRGGPAPLRDSEATMARRAERRMDRRTLSGRRANPYPGPYYPGVYPPE